MDNYEQIIKLIDEHVEKVEFADFGDGTSQNLISDAEKRLKISFPPSYVWWLKNYGGGYILGDEIYSVYGGSYDIPSGDVVYINELDRKKGFSSDEKLVIQCNDFGETYYFDLLKCNENGEFPVYQSFNGNDIRYADHFLEFLQKRILNVY